MAKKTRIEDRIRTLFQVTGGSMTTRQISELLDISQSSVCLALRMMRGAWISGWDKPTAGVGRWFAYWSVNQDPSTPTPTDVPRPPKGSKK